MSKKNAAPAVIPITDRIVRIAELATILGVHRSTIWRMCAEGRLVHPVEISAGTRGWRASEVSAWLAAREPAERAAE
jgi:predicted DNA-binding transcriptional regulator AlpA